MDSDRVLVARAQEDKEVFSELYERYLGQIFRYFASRTGDKDLAEDLSSETFIKAFDKFEEYDFSERPFKAWIFRIGHNVLMDHFRKKGNNLTSLEDIGEQADGENLSEKAHFKLLAAKIHDFLDDFSAEEKDILLMKLSSDLKFSEIAELLGKNESTIKTKYFRSLKVLKTKATEIAILIILLTLH
jgi:RNA polymerase sigma-70 factor (ECF subfamily)